MTRVAILQSNYVPWKGYFDLIREVDRFVFYDDVQYTKNDWRNRNRIKTPQGVQWLSIPVGTNLNRLVCEVALTDPRWQRQHWKTLAQCYASAPCWEKLSVFLRNVYLERTWTNLSDLNQFLIKTIARDYLGIQTEFDDSRQYATTGKKQDRLLELLEELKATEYLSGPAAQAYLDESAFRSRGIRLIYKSYQGYPEYPQLYPPFDHFVSIVDLLAMVGDDASHFTRAAV
jgi:hypothetical protein